MLRKAAMDQYVFAEEVVGTVDYERYLRALRDWFRCAVSPPVVSADRWRKGDQSQGKQAENRE